MAALLPDGARVLDLGCGPGLAARWLERRFDVVGVDLSKRQIAAARLAAPRSTFVVGDMTRLELSAGSFDAAVALYSLTHLALADIEPTLIRVANWLRPHGFLLATFGTVEGEGVQEDWLGVPMFFAGNTPVRNRAQLATAGFEVLRDQIVTIREPGEGDAAFHWVLARRLGDGIGRD
jgi:SAM-dependent methyltransferase